MAESFPPVVWGFPIANQGSHAFFGRWGLLEGEVLKAADTDTICNEGAHVTPRKTSSSAT